MIKTCHKKLWATIILVLVLLGFIHLTKTLRSGKQSFANQEMISAKAKGSPTAVIKVIEYSDFECPACGQAAKMLKQYTDKHSSQMYVEFRHYPLSRSHPHAITGAVFSECAAQQNQFWPYHDQLFEQRASWSRSIRVKGRLMDMAQDLSLDMESFRVCVEDVGLEDVIQEEKDGGRSRGVKATPTFFINDQMCVGARCLKDKLDELLKNNVL